ncbi:MAG: helix-turn-helix domain-containing protein [Acidimicrobiia bacterium]|nr:helix-turn-helix domain-containing protein [Acidimicrobiia bacterium]
MSDGQDAVFRALNDPGRRRLLDALFAEDGQTLVRLCGHLPTMTRYGVMNHLRVLEDAGLVTSIRDGRRKLHYLNPVPIRRVHSRWISKFAEPIVATLAQLPGPEGAEPMSTPSHRYQTFVASTPAEIWEAITSPDKTVLYYYGTSVESSWIVGDAVRYLATDGAVVADGEILAVEPHKRLELTFLPHWDPVLTGEGPARMAWIIDEADGLVRLTVEYYELDPESKQASDFMDGIPFIVAGLKTLLETGKPLARPV